VALWGQGAGSCRELHGAAGQWLPAQARPTNLAGALGKPQPWASGTALGMGTGEAGLPCRLPVGSWRPASYGVTDVGTDGPEGCEMGPWAMGRAGDPQVRVSGLWQSGLKHHELFKISSRNIMPFSWFGVAGWLGLDVGSPSVLLLFLYRITESQNSRGWKGPLWVI